MDVIAVEVQSKSMAYKFGALELPVRDIVHVHTVSYNISIYVESY